MDVIGTESTVSPRPTPTPTHTQSRKHTPSHLHQTPHETQHRAPDFNIFHVITRCQSVSPGLLKQTQTSHLLPGSTSTKGEQTDKLLAICKTNRGQCGPLRYSTTDETIQRSREQHGRQTFIRLFRHTGSRDGRKESTHHPDGEGQHGHHPVS